MSRFRFVLVMLLAIASNGGAAPKAATPAVPAPTGAEVDPIEKEFQALLAEDDAAQDEVDRWIRDEDAFAKAGVGARPDALQRRVRDRLDQVRKRYEGFLQSHPDHARAHLAFGSFLDDTNEGAEAEKHWDRARELNPDDPAAWNNLANYYGHSGSVEKSFGYYEKAISLNPREPVYYQNLATTVYLFRTYAMDHFKCDEAQVFDKSLALYRKAIELSPRDFPLATDYAQTFYGIKPMRTDEALAAWTNTLAIAHDGIEREGVYVHLARIKLDAGRFAEARTHLGAITNAMYTDIKTRLLRNLADREANATNAPPVPTAINAR